MSPTIGTAPSAPAVPAQPQVRAGKTSSTPFDEQHYLDLICARGRTIARLLADVKPALNLTTALDAGCGIGFFSQLLHDWGLQVQGFDGRLENVIEARRRFPRIPFAQRDIEDSEIRRLGEFDLVLCFGLLYHLENPMLAIRHLRALKPTSTDLAHYDANLVALPDERLGEYQKLIGSCNRE